jgi:hypothetical protein
MKIKCILATLMMSFFSISFANSKEQKKNEATGEITYIKKQVLGSCKINIYTKLDNGTVIEGSVRITSDEMNWFKCQGIKLWGLFDSRY